MYTTVRAHVVPMVKTFLNMTFKYKTTYGNLTHYGTHYTLLTHKQYGSSSLLIERLTNIESLTIKRFTYDEPTTTVQPDLLHAGRHEGHRAHQETRIGRWHGGGWNFHDIGKFILYSIPLLHASSTASSNSYS